MQEWDERRAMNHHLAGLIAFAHHNPKRMPKFEATGERKPEPPEVGQAKVRSYLKGLAMRGKGAG